MPVWLTIIFICYTTFVAYHWGWFKGYAYRSDETWQEGAE